jgi:hypothetical protein
VQLAEFITDSGKKQPNYKKLLQRVIEKAPFETK